MTQGGQFRMSLYKPLCGLDLPANVERMERWLEHEAPEAIEGAGGDQTTVGVAAVVRDFGLSEEKCIELMLDHWNETKASPPWDPGDLAIKVANAYRYGRNRPGCRQAGVIEFDAMEAGETATSPTTEHSDWPNDPTNLWLEESEPPDLAPGLLPELVERFARDAGRRVGVEPGAIAAAAVTGFAALIHAGNVIQVKQRDPKWVERAVLWTALVGEPGSKKSPALAQAISPVAALDAEWGQKYRRECATLADFADAKGARANGKPKTPPGPKRRRKIINDATTEAVAELLSENDGGLLFSCDELAGFFGGMDAYRPNARGGAKGGSKDRAFWLQAKDGRSYSVDRKTSASIDVPRNAVSIVGGVQPERLRSWTQDMAADGMLQRFWMVWVTAAGEDIDEPADGVLDEAISRLAHSLADAPSGQRYRFAPEADRERKQLGAPTGRETSRTQNSGALAEFLNKMPGTFARVALVFHFIEHYSNGIADLIGDAPPELISAATARRARRFLSGFILPHVRVVYHRCVDGGVVDTHSRWIAGHILAHGRERITDREIGRAYKALSGPDRRRLRLNAMAELEAEGWVKAVRSGRDGQPREWSVNPLAHDGRFKEIALQENEWRTKARESIAEIGAQRRVESASGGPPEG